MSAKQYDLYLLKEIRKYRVPSEVTEEAILLYFESLDCPRALSAWMLYRYGEHEQLANLSFDPLHYRNAEECRDAYSATEFLSKAKFLKLGYDLDARALEKFEKFELSCRSVNLRFRDLALDPLFKGRCVWLHNAVLRKISQILGEVDFQSIVGMSNWGPGATTLIKSVDASSPYKFQNESGITRHLLDLFPLELFGETYALWFKNFQERGTAFSLEVGNKVVTVPKNAKANRVIAIEPGFNLWFQKGIGSYMRNRLLRFGVDLNYQTMNQSLALFGSKTERLATIDFSSASDSISRELVRELLPPRWVALLDACRSHFGLLHGVSKHWEKFSSMGNGFTFELESLIFYATAMCVTEYLQVPLSREDGLIVSVYGDDVIIPTDCVALFAEMCHFYGFTVNKEKSHYDSPFRESCGKHYHSGIDVTPIYLKDRLLTVPSIFKLANAIRRQAHRRNSCLGCDSRLKKAFDHLVHSIPKAFRLRIESSLGDGGFISNWDEATPERAKHGTEGFRVKHVTEVGKTYKSAAFGLLLSRLWALEQRGITTSLFRSRAHDSETVSGRNWLNTGLHFNLSGRRAQEIARYGKEDAPEMTNNVSLRGKTKLKISLSSVAQWYDLGPWL